jgi:hypothetical protein
MKSFMICLPQFRFLFGGSNIRLYNRAKPPEYKMKDNALIAIGIVLIVVVIAFTFLARDGQEERLENYQDNLKQIEQTIDYPDEF